jgi:hypothetical protein
MLPATANQRMGGEPSLWQAEVRVDRSGYVPGVGAYPLTFIAIPVEKGDVLDAQLRAPRTQG